MRFALVALAFALPAASAAEAPVAPKTAPAAASAPARICSDAMSARNAQSTEPARLRRLGELPPGALTLTVVNRVGDCIEPMVVRQGFGAFEPRR